jgi:C4-dicarboxylate transporter DctM subunit
MLTVVFGVFVLLLALNMPVAFGLGIASVAGLLYQGQLPLNTLVTRMFVGVDSFTLLAIPFFIAAGEIMNACGITKRIVDFSGTLVGHIRGGLAHVTIVANMFFAGISGSATADASAIGSMLIPAMIKDGFDPDYAVAVNASASTMGPIIPPSILMVIYGSIANVSIAALFLGGFVPGVMIGLALMVIAYVVAIRRGYSARPRASWADVWRAFKAASLALIMPLIILGGILSGIFTPTEAGVVAVVYAIGVGCFVYKTITLRQLGDLLVRAAVTTTICLFVIAMASGFAWLLAWEGFGTSVINLLLKVTHNPQAMVFLVLGFILVLGLFFEGIPVLVIFAPILVPVMSRLHVDLVYFGVVLVISILIGSVTPPVGILTYICCAIARITVAQVFWIIWPFVAAMVAMLGVVTYFPRLIMFIPSMFIR